MVDFGPQVPRQTVLICRLFIDIFIKGLNFIHLGMFLKHYSQMAYSQSCVYMQYYSSDCVVLKGIFVFVPVCCICVID